MLDRYYLRPDDMWWRVENDELLYTPVVVVRGAEHSHIYLSGQLSRLPSGEVVGLGDMLVVTATEPKPERIQGAWVSEAEVHRVVAFVKEQQEARYRDSEVFEVARKREATDEEYEGEDPDIVRQAIELVVRSQLGSTSMLQRKLRIGFARAGRVMDIIENRGIVGPSEGSKPRTVLVTEDELSGVL